MEDNTPELYMNVNYMAELDNGGKESGLGRSTCLKRKKNRLFHCYFTMEKIRFVENTNQLARTRGIS